MQKQKYYRMEWQNKAFHEGKVQHEAQFQHKILKHPHTAKTT